ncbi:MAG: universal stress protein [Betaproteobacteria bacterium]|nr:universal stress protein [Betaproteobacteria bacterium]
MIQRILVAYDGSEPASKAFELAADLGKKYSASLHVLAVAKPPEFGDDVETEAILENSQRHYTKVLAALKNRAALLAVSPRFEIVVGHPADQIVYHAEQTGADLIVMGHRGKSFVKRLLIGSVSRQVMDHAHCAVLIVR